MARRARSESSSPPRSAARRARVVSRPRATSVSGRRAKSVFRTSGRTAEPASSGLTAKSSSVRAGARRAKTPPVVFPVSEPESLGRKATSLVVGASADKEPSTSAGPAGPAGEPPSLVRVLCLRCAKFTAKNPSLVCSFDKESSHKCSRCRAQKSKCPPISVYYFLPILLLIFVAPPLPGLVWPSAPALPAPAGGV